MKLEEGKVLRGVLEKPDHGGRSLAHAALARITYPKDPVTGKADASWLLYVKPTLTGREPVDLLQYHEANPAFPHEPTIDQFFDEAQWESYRRLGQHIAGVLFGRLDRLVPDKDRSSGKALLERWDWLPEEDGIKSYS